MRPAVLDEAYLFGEAIKGQFSEGTVATYVSSVRAVLKAVGPTLDPDVLDRFFASLKGRDRSYKLVAWRHYAKWAKGNGGMTVHVPGSPDAEGMAPTKIPMTPAIVDAAKAILASGMPVKVLLLTRWLDVDWAKVFYPGGVCKVAVTDIRDRETVFMVPFDALDLLLQHYNSENSPDALLIPWSKRPVQSYSESTFRQALKQFDPSPLEMADRLREESRRRAESQNQNQSEQSTATPAVAISVISLDELPDLDESSLDDFVDFG